MLNQPYRWFPFFNGWTAFTPEIPKLYWDVKSQEQRYFLMCKQLHKIICFLDYMGDHINMNHDEIEKLKKIFQDFIDGKYDEYYQDIIYKWIQENMPDIISAAIKMVYFGLTDDGYFCAYIPDTWNDITFDTGAVFGRTDYGRLILRFEADGAIDNTYSYTLAQPTKVNQLIADLETDAKRTDACFDTLFTNLNEDVILNGNI